MKFWLATVALGAALWSAGAFAQGARGDAARGALVFRACMACHSAKPGENMTGPSLAAIWDHKAGTVPGFARYSDALRRSGVTWDAATLDRWLRDPARFIPGTAMEFPGLPNPKDRADVIAFLEAVADGQARPPASVVKADLKHAPASAHVRSIKFCGDTYTVQTEDGRTRKFWDFNLRFKADPGKRGPYPGKPVILGAGMRGDRASVVFASPAEISGFIKLSCRASN